MREKDDHRARKNDAKADTMCIVTDTTPMTYMHNPTSSRYDLDRSLEDMRGSNVDIYPHLSYRQGPGAVLRLKLTRVPGSNPSFPTLLSPSRLLLM
jgi:hypothetical protein